MDQGNMDVPSTFLHSFQTLLCHTLILLLTFLSLAWISRPSKGTFGLYRKATELLKDSDIDSFTSVSSRSRSRVSMALVDIKGQTILNIILILQLFPLNHIWWTISFVHITLPRCKHKHNPSTNIKCFLINRLRCLLDRVAVVSVFHNSFHGVWIPCRVKQIFIEI